MQLRKYNQILQKPNKYPEKKKDLISKAGEMVDFERKFVRNIQKSNANDT